MAVIGFSTLLTVGATLFALFYAQQTMFEFYKMFNPPECDEALHTKCLSPKLEPQMKFDVSVYIRESPKKNRLRLKDKDLVFHETDLGIQSSIRTEIEVGPKYVKKMLKNSTLVAHIIFEEKNSNFVLYQIMPITRRKARTSATMGNLIENDEGVDQSLKLPISHLKQNLSLHIVEDYTHFPSNEAPPEVLWSRSLYKPQSFDGGVYAPVLWVNDLTNFQRALVSPEEVEEGVPLIIMYEPISLGYFRLMRNFQGNIGSIKDQGFSEVEADMIRDLVTTNIYVLSATLLVAILHSLFSFFAFKNEISFWSKKTGHAGISPRYVVAHCVMQIIIFLYLMDSGMTNPIVLVVQGAATIVDLWKVTRILEFKMVSPQNGYRYPSLGYKTVHQTGSKKEKKAESEVQKQTDIYDKKAMRWVFVIVFPCMIGYSVYSLLSLSHNSWYSWVIESLATAAYGAGFIFMLPQLFINYKLQSTAYLPWRAMTYKSLDTFVDDLFSFIISMPLLHRIAVFRDDVVFILFLVQKWKYKTDMTRVNEFGQSVEEFGGTKKKKES